MAIIRVTLTGARQVTFTFDAKQKPLINEGEGRWTGSFDATAGDHVYSAIVWGHSGDAWTLKVEGGKRERNHAGHMSPAGYDTSGDTAVEVA